MVERVAPIVMRVRLRLVEARGDLLMRMAEWSGRLSENLHQRAMCDLYTSLVAPPRSPEAE